MMIEEKPTVESEVADSESSQGVEVKLIASNRHRVALAAGLAGILIVAGVVLAVVGLVGNAFKGPTANKNETFDFTNGNNETSNIRGSPTSMPTSPLPAATELPMTTAPTSATPTTPSPTIAPSANSTSAAPSSSAAPTMVGSPAPSMNPTALTPEPTMMPQARPIINPVNFSSETLLTWCVIADVPYFDNETAALPGQIQTQMEGCEFLVHLGDINRGDVECVDDHYILIRELLWQSPIPTFMVPGDNEWNDCGNQVMIDAAWGRWTTYLSNFEDHWNHTIPVVRHLERPENFYFVMKRTLVFGLNIVGGKVQDAEEWQSRLTALSDWVRTISLLNVPQYADGVYIMAHARPTVNHNAFFNPLRRIVRDDFGNQVPFFYFHGDGHAYQYERGYLNQPNLDRMQHEGGTRDPIVKIYADPFFQGNEVHNAFQYDRQMQFDKNRKLKQDDQLQEGQLQGDDLQQ